MKSLLVLLWAAGELMASAPPSWPIENASLRLTLGADGSLTILDKVSRTNWLPAVPQHPLFRVSGVSIRRDRRSFEATVETGGAAWTLVAELAATNPEFDLTLSAPPETPLAANVEYPFALMAPNRRYSIVLPHKTGLLFSVEDAVSRRKVCGAYACYAGSGLSMPWFGLTNLERGLMVILETPMDTGVNVRLSGSVFSPQVYWQPARGRAGYPRKLHYRLLDRGGYVAMCKYYRNRLIQKGEFVTLREKQRTLPPVERLIGALDLHVRGSDQEQIDVVKALAAKGVKQMLLNSGASPQALAWMRGQGYLVGVYRTYFGLRPPGSRAPEYYQRGYPQDGYIEKNGTPAPGYAYSERRKTAYRCPLRQLPLMEELVPPLLREDAYQALFLDVVTASPPRECYSPAHPLDRRQDTQAKIALLKYATSLGVVVGSEDGNAWAAPYLAYFEGMAMPRRFGYSADIMTWPRPFGLSEEYKDVDLNERVRVPLWDLVFHDSVVSTWRWEHTPDRYPDPKWWDKQDLLQLIAGTMPIFIIDPDWMKTHGDRIVQSYKTCGEWNARTGWDELVDHRALTSDRSVQESRFSSGWAVTANFSWDVPYRDRDGSVLSPMSYQISRWR